MPLTRRLRETIDAASAKVLAAAGDTRRAILSLGAGVAAVALIALAALFLALRARKAIAA